MYTGSTISTPVPRLGGVAGLVSNISLFALGGTIASRWDETQQGATISLTADDLVRSLPGTGPDIVVHARSFRLCPSGDLSTGDIVELARAITSAVAGEADGVVVAQGTNTLEETAFLLDYLVGSSAPVVVTGAMRSAGFGRRGRSGQFVGCATRGSQPAGEQPRHVGSFRRRDPRCPVRAQGTQLFDGCFPFSERGPDRLGGRGARADPPGTQKTGSDREPGSRRIGATSGRVAPLGPGRRRDAAEAPEYGRFRRSSGRRLWSRARLATNDGAFEDAGCGNARSFHLQDRSRRTLPIKRQFCRVRARPSRRWHHLGRVPGRAQSAPLAEPPAGGGRRPHPHRAELRRDRLVVAELCFFAGA